MRLPSTSEGSLWAMNGAGNDEEGKTAEEFLRVRAAEIAATSRDDEEAFERMDADLVSAQEEERDEEVREDDEVWREKRWRRKSRASKSKYPGPWIVRTGLRTVELEGVARRACCDEKREGELRSKRKGGGKRGAP